MKAKTLLFASCLMLCGCASTQKSSEEAVRDSLPAISTIVYGVTMIVLDVALTPEERKVVSNDMYAWAKGFRSLCTGVAPSVDVVKDMLSTFGPTTNKKAKIGEQVAMFYASFYPSIKGNGKLALDVLEAVAHGCELAAGKVLDAPYTPDALTTGVDWNWRRGVIGEATPYAMRDDK